MSEFVYSPPIDGKPFKLAMGLRTLDPQAWLEGGDDLNTQLIERNELFSTQQDTIYGELDGYAAEIDYFTQLLVGNLKEFHGGDYEFGERSIAHLPSRFHAQMKSDRPLLELSRIIAEDLCILKKINGEWTLIAGAVLFPSRWKLSEKLGKSLDQIHQPVPGYDSGLQPYMTPTFEKITPDRAVWRKNWSLHSTSDLHQPESIHTSVSPLDYWWRTERQTLTRSAESEAILFTIRNRAEPLRWILNRSDEAHAFAETLASMSPETIEYKGLTSAHREIVDALMLAP